HTPCSTLFPYTTLFRSRILNSEFESRRFVWSGDNMFNTVKRAVPVVAVLGAGMVWMTIGTTAQSSSMPSTRNGDWTHYTADVRGSKYAPLDQINASNFNKLEVAWRFKTDNLGTRPEFKLEGTPLAIRGVL